MAQLFVGPGGSREVTVSASEYLAVRSIGDTAKVYYKAIGGYSVPSSWVFLQSVTDEEVILSAGAAGRTYRIDAGGVPVLYEAGAAPFAVFWVPPQPMAVHQYFNDFDTYVAGDWTLTTVEAGAGSATEALTNVKGGALLVTNAAGDNDHDFFQKVGESFKFESGKRLWFEIRLQTSDATDSDIVAGLQITDNSPLAVSDGVFFLKADGAATADFLVEKDSTATTAAAVATLADDTWITLGFMYDGASAIHYYVDRVLAGTSVTTNMPDDEELTISFGIQNGEAAAKTLTVDYIFAAQER